MPPRARRSSASASASTSASPATKSKARGRPSNASSASAKSTKSAPASKPASRSQPQKSKASGKSKQTPIYLDDDSDEDEEEEDVDDSEDDFQAEDDDDEEEDDEGDDDASEDDYQATGSKKSKASPVSLKRKSTASTSSTSASKKQKTRRKSKDQDTDEDFDDDDDEDSGRIRQSHGLVRSGIGAPTSGHVPPRQVSPHLFNLLKDLCDPAKNDRDWFKGRDKLWRYCEQSWLSFIETLTENIMEKTTRFPSYLQRISPTASIAMFSNDKTPYKTEMQVTFSRTGRKGNWAGYHLSVSPFGRSYIAGGKWHPDSRALGKIRQHILENDHLGQELREIVSAKEFVKMFGAPVKSVKELTKDMGRKSLWGFQDQLKVAPKINGLEPDNPAMHWLRLKSFTVSRRFSDEEVLKPGFQDQVSEVVRTMRPLISVMNRMVFGEDIDGEEPPDDAEDDEDDDDE
ncbi:hypothetical protein OC846_003139 [Tilletia horrida]|uniref:TIGR02453 family protein n=1 Tax=Tilletia horrida TaxID=155126 RepID=A0AAN6GQ21_9BASI|nr:hypothetical protein OC846_003139 [Tilletia horrida]